MYFSCSINLHDRWKCAFLKDIIGFENKEHFPELVFKKHKPEETKYLQALLQTIFEQVPYQK